MVTYMVIFLNENGNTTTHLTRQDNPYDAVRDAIISYGNITDISVYTVQKCELNL